MPVKLSVTEKLAFALNLGPPPVVDYLGAMALRAVSIAQRIGVFRVLEHEARSAAEVGTALGAHEGGIQRLLCALESVGYVQRRAERYQLTPMAAKWIPRFREGMHFFDWMAFEGWQTVEQELCAAPGATVETAANDPPRVDAERSFGGNLSTARAAADEMAQRISIPGSARRLLDLAGGHGLYAARFCERNPNLSAVLFDRAEILARASLVLAGEKAGDRIELRAGDLWTDSPGKDYDVVLAFNLLNAIGSRPKLDLLRLAADALAPGGILVIMDAMRRPDLRGSSWALIELTNLRMFAREEAATYQFADLAGWLQACGLRPGRAGALRSSPWTKEDQARA